MTHSHDPGQESLPQPAGVMSSRPLLRTAGRVTPRGTWMAGVALGQQDITEVGTSMPWDARLSLAHDAVCSREAKVAAGGQSENSSC